MVSIAGLQDQKFEENLKKISLFCLIAENIDLVIILCVLGAVFRLQFNDAAIGIAEMQINLPIQEVYTVIPSILLID